MTINRILWPPPPSATTLVKGSETESVALAATLIRHLIGLANETGPAVGGQSIKRNDLEALARELKTTATEIQGWSRDQIKGQHRKLVLKYHPDKLGGLSYDKQKEGEEKFKKFSGLLAELRDQKAKSQDIPAINDALCQLGQFNSYAVAEVTPVVLGCTLLSLLLPLYLGFAGKTRTMIQRVNMVRFLFYGAIFSAIGIGMILFASFEKAYRTMPNGSLHTVDKQPAEFRYFLRLLAASLVAFHVWGCRRYSQRVGFGHLWTTG